MVAESNLGLTAVAFECGSNHTLIWGQKVDMGCCVHFPENFKAATTAPALDSSINKTVQLVPEKRLFLDN